MCVCVYGELSLSLSLSLSLCLCLSLPPSSLPPTRSSPVAVSAAIDRWARRRDISLRSSMQVPRCITARPCLTVVLNPVPRVRGRAETGPGRDRAGPRLRHDLGPFVRLRRRGSACAAPGRCDPPRITKACPSPSQGSRERRRAAHAWRLLASRGPQRAGAAALAAWPPMLRQSTEIVTE